MYTLTNEPQLPTPCRRAQPAQCVHTQYPAQPGAHAPFSRSTHCSTPDRSGEVASCDRMGPSARRLGAMNGDSSGIESVGGRWVEGGAWVGGWADGWVPSRSRAHAPTARQQRPAAAASRQLPLAASLARTRGGAVVVAHQHVAGRGDGVARADERVQQRAQAVPQPVALQPDRGGAQRLQAALELEVHLVRHPQVVKAGGVGHRHHLARWGGASASRGRRAGGVQDCRQPAAVAGSPALQQRIIAAAAAAKPEAVKP